MKKQILLILMLLLVSSSFVSAIKIVDPVDNSTIARSLDGEIIVSIHAEEGEKLCEFRHPKVPEDFLEFQCDNIVEITTPVVYSGIHEFEVAAYKDGEFVMDKITIIVNQIVDKNTEEATKVNMDNLVCLEGADCLWDNQKFTDIAILASLVGLFIFIYFEMGGKE